MAPLRDLFPGAFSYVADKNIARDRVDIDAPRVAKAAGPGRRQGPGDSDEGVAGGDVGEGTVRIETVDLAEGGPEVLGRIWDAAVAEREVEHPVEFPQYRTGTKAAGMKVAVRCQE
ncbi:MAG: hypothetical protein ACI80K_001651, partial [Paracoccaceae bacterium]